MAEQSNTKPRLRLRVTAAAETAVRSGHPWVYADSVREQNRPGETGEVAAVYDRRDRLLALGLYDAGSPIRLRVLHAGDPTPLNEDWWRRRLMKAIEHRRALFESHGNRTTGYRWIYGESDGWPGLVLDRYGDVLVMKLYSEVWLSRLEEVQGRIRECLGPQRIVLRSSRNIRVALEGAGYAEGGSWAVDPTDGAWRYRPAGELPESVVFWENGIQFESDVVRGQKTGFYLDQRENREWVGAMAGGRRVLNVFSFSGGFSLYAARGGARSVTDVDISSFALESARRNRELPGNRDFFKNCPHQGVQADAFEWLSAGGERYDVVVLDPPSMARREADREGAIRAYGRLAELGLRRVAGRGTLVAASCSAHVSADEFFGVVRQMARRSGRAFRELRTVRHPGDHPARFLEAEYLKAIYLEMDHE